MSNFQAFAKRIEKANDLDEILKLDLSLDRLYNNGIFTTNQVSRLDLKLCDRKEKIKKNA